jgi:hypothetical protein
LSEVILAAIVHMLPANSEKVVDNAGTYTASLDTPTINQVSWDEGNMMAN